MAKVTANTISASRTAAMIHWIRFDGGAAGGGAGGSPVMRWSVGVVGWVLAPGGRSGRRPSRAVIESSGCVLSLMALCSRGGARQRSRLRRGSSRAIIVYARRQGQGLPNRANREERRVKSARRVGEAQ